MLHWEEVGNKQQIGVVFRGLTCVSVKCGKEFPLEAWYLRNMAKDDTSGVDGLILSN